MAFLTFVLPKLSSLLPNAGSKEGLSARQASGSLWHQWWWHRSVAILNRSRAAHCTIQADARRITAGPSCHCRACLHLQNHIRSEQGPRSSGLVKIVH